MRYITVFFTSFLVIIVVYFPLCLSLAPAPISAEYWVREMIVIKRSIVKRFEGQNKIIIVSGSNALFNIDTNQLSKNLKVPVINFALHAGLSLKNLLNEADLATDKGDSIILPLEPHYYCISEPTEWQARNGISWDRETWNKLPFVEKIQAMSLLKPIIILRLILAKIQENLLPESIDDRLTALNDTKILAKFSSSPKPKIFAYSAYNLDKLGNMQKIEGANYHGVPRSPETIIDLCPESLKQLEKFTSKMSKKGVAVYFANTPYVKTNELDKDKIEKASNYLKLKLTKLGPMLDDRYQLVMDRVYFFNSDLHLNSEGRKLRTEILSKAIIRDKTFFFDHKQ